MLVRNCLLYFALLASAFVTLKLKFISGSVHALAVADSSQKLFGIYGTINRHLIFLSLAQLIAAVLIAQLLSRSLLIRIGVPAFFALCLLVVLVIRF